MELCHCLSGSEQRRIQALPCRRGGRARGEEWSSEASNTVPGSDK